VKHGEDKTGVSGKKKNFFWGLYPPKHLHHLHREVFSCNSIRWEWPKMAFFADRHAKSEAE
jgi:hypothetical protein